MRFRILATAVGMALLSSILAAAHASPIPQEKKEYLSDSEADKIRDAYTSAERIKLFLSFADDRMKKFQYESARATPERQRGEILNGLLNGYEGCIDDAADQIQIGEEKQEDIRAALKEFASKGKVFTAFLQKIDKNSPDYDSYQDTLADAIEGTKEALSDVDTALKAAPAAPVRRKPS
ncbi:MAG: hypothetical protein ACRD4S_08350 [Candidatus Acidiferrales bacterium]